MRRRLHAVVPVLAAARPPAEARGARSRLHVSVLSRRPNLYTIRRFREAAAARGDALRILDPLQCHLMLAGGGGRIGYQGRELRRPDVVLPRIGPSSPTYALAVVNQFELMGVPLVNGFGPIARARDKLLSLQILAGEGVAIPRTVVARNPSHLPQSLAEVGGPPVVLKLAQGTQGVGVMLADSRHAVEATLDTLWSLGQNILIQEFVAESRGRDVRALVIGGRVVAAMRRQAKLGEFRSNIHRGGEGTGLRVEEIPAYAQAALRATRALGLEVAGVDMLESDSGPKVIEINASPGFEGLELATGLDVASLILEHAEQHAARPGARA